MRGSPGITHLGGVDFVNDAVLSMLSPKRPITIDYEAWNAVVEKNTLYGRQTASPGKYAPFFLAAAITAYTPGTPSVTVSVADAAKFAASDAVNFYDTSAAIIDAGDNLTISSIASTTGVITLSAEFDNVPTTSDFLVLMDGTQLSEYVVMVEEEIDFSSSRKPSAFVADVLVSAIYQARLNLDFVNRTTYFAPQRCQRLFMDEPQR